MPGKAPEIGPYSRQHRLAKLDERTKEARILRETRSALIEHIGGRPSAVQAALIDRAAWLTLRVAQLDARIADGTTFTEHDSRTYLAWSNSLARTLAALGLKPTPAPAPTLAEVLGRGGPDKAAA